MHGSYARSIMEQAAVNRYLMEQAAVNRYLKKEEGPLPQPVPCHPTAEQPQATQPTKEKDDVA